ncbi:hypothetical protein KUF71_012257 [Frankliniella fusca]|uniref:Nucleolar and spindle-associated protein 1 n=1 Tax=Frankliniella fusca TaxID=407009 RepID=A0AAE1HN30_9NEOP|nr:hypothetical protein KUF71_012257 [Frankliniella fusca]
MDAFDIGKLESFKYADLVKLAKENGVYRRYAPKAELVEKLMALCERPIETLSDVSMPTFTDDETDSEKSTQGIENTSPVKEDIKQNLTRRRGEENTKKKVKVVTLSPRSPLLEKERYLNNSSVAPENEASVILSSNVCDSQPMRRSLAGPAKSTVGRAKRGKLLKNCEIEKKQDASPEPTARRMTRQNTFDIDTAQPFQSHRKKRGGTFAVQDSEEGKECHQTSSKCSVKREGTFEVDHTENKKITQSSSRPHKLRRESTFEVQDIIKPTRSVSLRREGTFELEDTQNLQNDVQKTKPKREGTFEVEPKATSEVKKLANYISETKKTTRGSLGTPLQSKRLSAATPMSVKTSFGATRLNITSHSRAQELVSSGKRLSGSKLKIPSVINEIHRKKAEVSAQKRAGTSAGYKPIQARKVPDFSAIHNRIFDKMESIADSIQKVKDKAFSSQKHHPVKSGKKSPPKAKAVRKLLSPKIGKTKLSSPKPLYHSTASAFASKVVSIQKRPSTGSSIPGVSKLLSPKPVFNPKSNGVSTKFGFAKVEPTRKEVLKASVMERKPMKRHSPMSKAKQALNTVRLNKRFELQMKHRIAQQANQN